MTKKVGLSLFAAMAVLPVAVLAETVAERLKPVGEVCMAGDECAAEVVASAGAEPRTGEQVYSTKCFICHATGTAGAPKLGDAPAWAGRIAERGIDGLYNSANNGFNGMPAKGTCADCSDDEIKAAVDHMVENSK